MKHKEWKMILASASPRRRELLLQTGICPIVEPSHVEEVITSTEPDQVVMELSRQKAEDIAGLHRGEQAVVIGADTVVAIDGMILGKPKDRNEAMSMISRIQGRKHQVYTGVTLCFGETGRSVTFAEKTDVYVYPMTAGQVDAYMDAGEQKAASVSFEWEDKAGGYAIQGYFARFIEKIDGDYYNVVGLPVGRVCQELMKAGIVF